MVYNFGCQNNEKCRFLEIFFLAFQEGRGPVWGHPGALPGPFPAIRGWWWWWGFATPPVLHNFGRHLDPGVWWGSYKGSGLFVVRSLSVSKSGRFVETM